MIKNIYTYCCPLFLTKCYSLQFSLVLSLDLVPLLQNILPIESNKVIETLCINFVSNLPSVQKFGYKTKMPLYTESLLYVISSQPSGWHQCTCTQWGSSNMEAIKTALHKRWLEVCAWELQGEEWWPRRLEKLTTWSQHQRSAEPPELLIRLLSTQGYMHFLPVEELKMLLLFNSHTVFSYKAIINYIINQSIEEQSYSKPIRLQTLGYEQWGFFFVACIFISFLH